MAVAAAVAVVPVVVLVLVAADRPVVPVGAAVASATAVAVAAPTATAAAAAVVGAPGAARALKPGDSVALTLHVGLDGELKADAEERGLGLGFELGTSQEWIRNAAASGAPGGKAPYDITKLRSWLLGAPSVARPAPFS